MNVDFMRFVDYLVGVPACFLFSIITSIERIFGFRKAKKDFKPKKILFIEDEMKLQEALTTKLKNEGYDIFSALDGEEGLKMAEEQKPDLILLDIILPKKDGFGVLETIKAKPELNSIPVIVLTNLESEKDVERCLNYGVHSYLAKANYSLEEIAQKVKEALE